MLSFKWFGQACFEIKDSKTIVTDPHDGESVGLEAPKTEADIVTISHDHFDHSSGKEDVSKEDTKIVDAPGKTNIQNIHIEGIESYHDKSEGDARGKNTIYKINIDGFSICHLGDLGHLLEDNTLNEIKPVDILLIPVGGKFTIDGKEAYKVVEEINPQVVIPMHYNVPGLEVPISKPDAFLELAKKNYDIENSESLKLDGLPENKTLYKLKCLT